MTEEDYHTRDEKPTKRNKGGRPTIAKSKNRPIGVRPKLTEDGEWICPHCNAEKTLRVYGNSYPQVRYLICGGVKGCTSRFRLENQTHLVRITTG